MIQRKRIKIYSCSCAVIIVVAALLSAPHTTCTAFQSTIRRHTFTRGACFRKPFTRFSSNSDSNEDDTSEDGDLSAANENEFTETFPQPIGKFTGATQSLFSGQSASSASSNLAREREREFNLAGNFERTFGIQVVILVASIVFVAYVGLTGGITDGSNRDAGGADELDDTVIERFQTDDAAEAAMFQRQPIIQESVWL